MFKNRKISCFLLLLLLLVAVPGMLSAQTPCPSCQISMETPNAIPANRIKFWMYTPPGNDGSTPAPLLINLHGQGQIGDNLNLLINQSSDATPAYLIAQSQWPASRPFIVVSPQLKRDLAIPNIGDQDWIASYIDEVVEYVKTQRNINANKIYIMGLSLGGQGCMIYSAAYPGKVAAMVPICGRTDDIIQDGMACSLVNIPTWIFHGTEDNTLNYSNATNMAAAINACPNSGSIKPHVTLLDAGEHTGISVWNPLYNLSAGYPIYDWLLQFTKNSTANVLPYVNVGTDKKFLTSDDTIYLFGEYFDDDGSIASVAWTQMQGVALTLQQTNNRILKVSNLQAGTFQFRLTVTDNLGGTSTDDVTVELFDSVPVGLKSVTSLRLTNAATGNTEIGPLVNEQVINKSELGTNDLNVRAIMSTEGGSVVFKVNSNQFTRGLNGWEINNFNNLYVYPNDPWYAPNGWKILIGDHVLCASPYADNGTEGISKCVKFSVINPILKHYYPKPGLDLSLLTSWGINPPDGGGAPPGYFNHGTNSNFQVFNVNKVATQSGSLAIGGNESALWVRNDGEMNVNNTFTGVINVEGNGIVNVNTSQPVAFGSVSPTSTIRFGATATSIPAHTYGNVVVQSGTKTLSSGATIITGNLTIANDVIVNGAVNNTSTIQLTGNLILQEDNEFNPATKFGLTFSGGTPHAISLTGTKAVFTHLTVLAASVVTVNEGTVPKTFEFGYPAGGGVIVENGSELNLGKNHLTITGNGTINSQNQTGRIAFNRSKLSVTSQATSNLYTKTTLDTVSVAITNLTGAGALFLRDSLFVLDSVKIYNGTLHANGFLTLVSSAYKTASIGRVEGTGNILGAVRFHRFIRPGRLYRYLSFPVENVKVSDLQKYVDVTGPFTGASTGPGLSANPSLFQYQEPAKWIPFPATSNNEVFTLGKGYSVFVREEQENTVVKVAGEIHTGDFTFQLTPGSADSEYGWSLLGNPYAAPLQWSATGWQRTGINPTVNVKDNEYEGGRFLTWDGETGDGEFAGLIAQGQSFWVKAFDPNITPSLTVQESAKSGTQATLFRTKQEPNSTLTISLNHNGLTDRTFLKFNDRAGLKFDAKMDGVKKQNSYYNLATLTIDSVLIAIKNMPDTCRVTQALAVENTKPGTYVFGFSGTALDIDSDRIFFLHDNYLDSIVTVRSDQVYRFQITAQPETFGRKRFQLVAEVDMPQPEVSVADGILKSSAVAGNQWLLNGEVIEGATQPSYKPVVNGDYQVQVIKSSCSKISAPFTYVITGIEPQHFIQLYPNPAQHSVSVKGILNPTPYKLINQWGQAVHSGLLTPAHTEIELKLPSGLYLLALNTESGIQRHKFIIKK